MESLFCVLCHEHALLGRCTCLKEQQVPWVQLPQQAVPPIQVVLGSMRVLGFAVAGVKDRGSGCNAVSLGHPFTAYQSFTIFTASHSRWVQLE